MKTNETASTERMNAMMGKVDELIGMLKEENEEQEKTMQKLGGGGTEGGEKESGSDGKGQKEADGSDGKCDMDRDVTYKGRVYKFFFH